MDKKQRFAEFTVPIIDVAKTSKNLKEIRENQKISISDLKSAYGFSDDIVDYINKNSSEFVIIALRNYFAISSL